MTRGGGAQGGRERHARWVQLMPVQLRGDTAGGFSVIELVVATGLVVTLAAVSFFLLSPAHGMFATQSEVIDMQQRLRVTHSALHDELASAGAGTTRGRAGPLHLALPPVLPYRLGPRAGDPPGTVVANTVTVISVPVGAAQATIDQPMPARTGAIVVRLEPGCPLGDLACGFAADMDVLLHDGTAAFDLFTVVGVTASTLTLQHLFADWAKVYPPGSALVQIQTRTYFWRDAQTLRPPQLVRYGGGSRADVPVVDHVVGVGFDYFGDPAPPTMLRPLSEPKGPWTTYGPPPPPDLATAPVVPASSCLFLADGTPFASPRLPSLGTTPGALVRLTPAQLGDGPFCPDDDAPARFDADLLRIRSVGVTLRVQAAAAALRGPAGALFSRGGSARAGASWAPDIEVRFRVTPRSLVLGY